MTGGLRSHVSIRSRCFQDLIAERLDGFGECLEDFRPLWREADRLAKIWRERATTVYDHASGQWVTRSE
jgi:hypothetical protein